MLENDFDRVKKIEEFINSVLDGIEGDLKCIQIEARKRAISEAAARGDLSGGGTIGTLINIEKRFLKELTTKFIDRIEKIIKEKSWFTKGVYFEEVERLAINKLHNKFLESNEYIKRSAKGRITTPVVHALSTSTDDWGSMGSNLYT